MRRTGVSRRRRRRRGTWWGGGTGNQTYGLVDLCLLLLWKLIVFVSRRRAMYWQTCSTCHCGAGSQNTENACFGGVQGFDLGLDIDRGLESILGKSMLQYKVVPAVGAAGHT